MQLFRDFTIPRERVPTEVGRAFRAIYATLKNMEQAISDLSPSDAAAVSELRAEVKRLAASPKFARPDPKAVVSRTTTTVTPTPPPDPVIIFSSRIR